MILVSRIIGNTLPGRHGPDAQYNALKFILENEQRRGVAKHWVLNRIYDDAERRRYEALLDAYQYPVDIIPFSADDYKASKDPSHYLTNINAARNFCVRRADETGLKFCLPLDSRCIFTEEDWVFIEECCLRAIRSETPYVIIPQARLSYEEWDRPLNMLDFRTKNQKTGEYLENEYALGLNVVAPLQFDEERPFGRADKAELLAAIGVNGPWERWVANSGVGCRYVDEAIYGKCFAKAPRGIRVLPSGNQEADKCPVKRFSARAEGLARLVSDCNLRFLEK